MVENNRSHVATLMRFFSIDSEMSLPNDAAAVVAPETAPPNLLWTKQFLLKVVQLFTGFVCVGVYAEGLKFLKDSINTMMYPNIVYSSFIIITSVILLSCLLGCAMPDVLIRIFNILGMVLYFAAATVTLYESLARKTSHGAGDEVVVQRQMLFATSVMSYFNTVLYAVDVYFSIRRAVSFEAK
ncbi:hypothetical protein NQ315_001484 [Exocentrus adspersus]|uniref:MARVEL domain-containing protein n=1 Tax=Exocentrus adspersus TaxID=1586481 RepID=A0AAV8W8V5_9CUCU|nr:hypothetical protein NQ315_001484 [Exocentrus adspersus]